MTAKTIAILGAGPTGIEAALHAAHRGYDVHVYERGAVGAHIRQWGHVTLFSPWGLNRSPLGEAMLRESGAALPDADTFPTGASYLSEYLEPLAAHPLLAGRIHSGTEALGVSRHDALKGQFVGGRSANHVGAFWLHLRAEQGERFERADLVIDATGAYRTANALGPGGLPARGEFALTDDRLTRYIPDVLGEDEARYAGKRTLVVGAGYSAITSLKALHELKARHPGTQLSWLTWQAEAPYGSSKTTSCHSARRWRASGTEQPRARSRASPPCPAHGSRPFTPATPAPSRSPSSSLRDHKRSSSISS